MDYDLNQDKTVDDQEEQSGEPDQQEGVVPFKLQEVGRPQPNTLGENWRENCFSFILSSILTVSLKNSVVNLQR